MFVHGGSPFLIIRQLLPEVNVDLHTYKVSFAHIFESQMGTADWALALSELPVSDVFWNATVFRFTNVA